ncbi:hypothetical protein LCGC14_1017350 [marine sediment metagenome]|uniref:Uncharacterized protein n=1 Tax=marine sediment metagenome TaxID=412755 RepID=A0A0F9QGR6_9ZZZZ
MNTLEKAKIWLGRNNIKFEYGNDKKHNIESIKIWIANNSYYWIYRHTGNKNKNRIIRTNITQETFDIECYRPSGSTYIGSLTRRLSFDELKKRLKSGYHR